MYKLTHQTEKDFVEVVEIVNKSKDLLVDVSKIFQEQTQGIEQTKLAMDDIAGMIQNIAATAKESATASEEMHAK